MRLPFAVRVFTIALALIAGAGAAVSAHPLGNFTINHLSELKFDRASADVRYVLDMAEIPTYAAMRERSSSATFDAKALALWAHDEAEATLPQLDLRVDGKNVPLALLDARAKTRPGAGGLPTLYLVVDARGSFAPAARARSIVYSDATFANRLGWRDAIVSPQREPTGELQHYPNALLGSPRSKTALAGELSPSGAVALSIDSPVSESVSSAPAPSAVRSNQLADMLAKGTRDPWFVVLTLLVAIVLGALHALEPGHGKTLLAVSLVGARATVSQAAILASSLTVAHTAGVLALGLAIIALKGAFVPENIYPWITLLSGIAIAVVGARAVQRQLQLRLPFAHEHVHAHDGTHPHAHDHEHHPHDHAAAHSHAHESGHDHSHDDEAHARAHAIPGSAPLKFGPTVWAAMSGGVAPCPAALVVLFAALAQNVLGYGIVAIVFFSFGLAATLTGLGIGVVRGASWLQGRPQFERFVKWGPLGSAIVIATIGAVMVGQGFAENGFSLSPLAAAGLTALAIAGYAFSHPFAHRHTTQVA